MGLVRIDLLRACNELLCSLRSHGDTLCVGLCPVGDYSLHVAVEAWPGGWLGKCESVKYTMQREKAKISLINVFH